MSSYEQYKYQNIHHQSPLNLQNLTIQNRHSHAHDREKKQKWGGNVNADFCCHRGTLDSAKVKTQSCIKPTGVPNSYQKCPILDRGGGILGESQISHG